MLKHKKPVNNKLIFNSRLVDWYLELVGIVAQLDLEQKAIFSSLKLGFPLQLGHQVVQQTFGFRFLRWVVQLH